MGRVNALRQALIDAQIEKYLEEHPECDAEEAHNVVMCKLDPNYDRDPS